MKPTRLITICLLAIAFASCTTVRYTQNIVTVTPQKDIVANKIGNDIVHFNLRSLSNSMHGMTDTVYPILTHRTAGTFIFQSPTTASLSSGTDSFTVRSST